MYAYKEILTIDDPRTLTLAHPLPLAKGQRIEVLILAADDDAELEQTRDAIAARGISEADVADAIAWARAAA